LLALPQKDDRSLETKLGANFKEPEELEEGSGLQQDSEDDKFDVVVALRLIEA